MLGLIIVIGATFVLTMSDAEWNDAVHFVSDNPFTVRIVSMSPTGTSAETTKQFDWQGWLVANNWSRFVIGGLILLLGTWALKSSPVLFLVTASLLLITAYCIEGLLHTGVAPLWIVIGALVLAYFIHCSPRTAPPSIRGMIGFALISLSCYGMAHDWFDWAKIDARLGGHAKQFFVTWGVEAQWATVLVLTALGVSMSRRRPVHFLNAVMLGVLAYYCVSQGFEKVATFPELARNGVVPTVTHDSFRNVEMWRWVLSGELVLLGLVLLHLALGVGGLTIMFGVAWIVIALQADKAVGRMQITRALGQFVANTASRPVPQERPLDGMGLPVTPAPGIKTDGELTVREGDLNAMEAQRVEHDHGQQVIVIDEATARVGGVVPIAWVYLTSILGGVLIACGLRMTTESPAMKQWVTIGLWFGFGAGVAWLATVWPMNPERSWQSWMATWGLSRYHVYAILLSALGAAAFTASWALRESSRYETWARSCIGAVFCGTVLSLGAVGLLIRYGGFSPLPVWSYAVIAAGQSSLMWVLLMHLSMYDRDRGRTVAVRA